MTEMIDTTVYLQIKQKDTWRKVGSVAKATNKEPAVVDPGCVVVKIKVRIPSAAFKPLQPSAVVEIPEELIQHEVQVEAVAE